MRLRLLPALLLAPGLALAAKPDLPKPALKALESANGILGTTSGDERVLACLDALPFLDIVVAQAPNYPYAVGLAAECRYLTDDFEKAVPLLEKYIALVPPKARQKEAAEKVEKAELRLMKAKAVLAERKEQNRPAIVVKQSEPPKPVEPPKPETVVAVKPVEPPPPPPPPPAEPTVIETPLEKEFAVRAGLDPAAGVLGVGAELRLGNVAFGLGTGGYPIGGGLRWLVPAGPGAAYVEGHAVWAATSPFVRRSEASLGLGVTAGYDYRPIPMLSVKLGLGVAHVGSRGTGLVLDAAVGPVFGF